MRTCEMCGKEAHRPNSSGTYLCDGCHLLYLEFLCNNCAIRVVTPKQHSGLCTSCELQNWWSDVPEETKQAWKVQILNGRWMDVIEEIQEALCMNANQALRVTRWIEEERLH